MKQILYTLLGAATLLLASCHSTEVRISGKFIGLNAKTVYLEQMGPSGQSIIDSVALADDGAYRFVIKSAQPTPTMYNIVYNNERIPLLLSGGESLTVGAIGSVLANYTVEGSAESELLREFNREYIAGMQRLNVIMAEYSSLADGISRENAAKAYTDQYREIKRAQITFIIEHKSSIAAVYALYQRLPGEQYLSSVDSDVIYFRTVADALSETYPLSPYLVTLRNDVARMEARQTLLNTIQERSYPDLEAKDMYGNPVRLSSLEGNVILVDFWAAEAGNSNALNAELRDIYAKYADKGFAVYQVSADLSKATWISAIQEQRLPWVSVCDFRGMNSPLLGLYNVRSLPSNYLIDRNGTIIEKNIYSTALDRRLAELLR